MLVKDGVLLRLLLAQGSLLLELRAPEGLDAVHAGAELCGRHVQLPFHVGVLVLDLIQPCLKLRCEAISVTRSCVV